MTLGDILSINGIPVSDLIVGTTMFPDPPASEPQPAENADNFSLATAACADNQPYMQTMFGQAVTTIFIFEKSGNDNGSMQALDAGGDPVGNAVVFSPADFASTGYTGYGDQVAFGTVITSDIPNLWRYFDGFETAGRRRSWHRPVLHLCYP